MEDTKKSRSQLIHELQKMRNRVAVLERKLAAEERPKRASDGGLWESEERLRLALDATNDGIWDWNPETGRSYFSPRYGSFEDLFNLSDIQRLQDLYAKAFGVAAMITRPDGTPITKSSNFTVLCSQFIRNTAKGSINCHNSDALLGRNTPEGPIVQRCPGAGLWNVAASITVGGRHIASWLIGQVRYESQNEEEILAYARELGADENAFRAAYRQMPTMSREQFESVAQLLFAVVNQLSMSAYQNVQQARFITERKQIEESLRLARFIIDRANVGIYRIAPQGRIIEVNQKAARLLGYTKEELENLSMSDIDPLIALDSWHSNWQQLNAQGTRDLELEHRKKDGSTIPVEVHSNLLAYDGQEYAIAFVQDITERKKAAAALRENEQLLGNILESMSEGVLVLDSDFRYTIFNKAMEILTDTPREKVLGKRPWDVFSFLKGSPIEENQRKAMKGEVAVGMEICSSLPHNPNSWTRDCFSPIRDADGHIIGIVGVVNDITQHKQDEEELRRLRNYLSNIIDSMPSMLVAVDSDGKVTQWNHQTEQTTGLSFEEARCQPLSKVFPYLAGEMERIKMSIRERRVIRAPKVSRKVEHEIRYEDITIFPLVTNGVEGAVIRVDDVTQQIHLEEMMIQSEKMLSVGGLAAGMAHEINNPLAGILQSVSILENRLLGDLPANRRAAAAAGITLNGLRAYLTSRKLLDMIGNIRESGTRAADIVRNMLSFVRKSDRVVSRRDIGGLLDRTVELVCTDYDMKKRFDFKQIKITREYDPLSPSIPCEASKLQQVFMNILKNGAEAMAATTVASDPPAFVLRVKDDGDRVQVEIEDNGPGMDDTTRRRIFEPFFTTKPVGFGTGLGLSVSYFIITEDHGGEMSVQAAESGGACFVIHLPKAGRA